MKIIRFRERNRISRKTKEGANMSTGYRPPTCLCKNGNAKLFTIQSQTDVETVLSNFIRQPIRPRNWTWHNPTKRRAENNSPKLEEIKEVLKTLKNNKAPGIDNRIPELYKVGGDHLLKHVHVLIETTWREEKILEDWKMMIICPIYKKGDQLVCKNIMVRMQQGQNK